MITSVDPAQMYNQAWGKAQHPYPFQRRVAELLAQGKRVVLQAPTGAGKTRAALTAFLYHRQREPLPGMAGKCLYAVPMRVLATQFFTDQAQLVGPGGPRVTIQTGEEQRDRRLGGDLVFLTIDQLLSSFLTMPYSLPLRQANLNAGAVTGSFIVLDEFHLLDPTTTLPTALDMLARLEGLGPMLIMTATFSSRMLGELARLLKAEVVTTPPDEVRQIETRWGKTAPRQRTWRTAPAPLTAEAVLAAHRRRTLVVCNQVARAQALYDQLCGKGKRVILLHSRFLHEDRQRWEHELQEAFARDSNADMIAVATQVVEVGLDLSADTLHTELAPAAALIQRAGRCARYPGECGDVWVYPVEKHSPYAHKADDPLALEMDHALDWLSAHSGQVLGFPEEQALVDAVTAARDGSLLEALGAAMPMQRQRIDKALGGDRAVREASQLVRDADSRRLLIHDCPEHLLAAPYAATGFSLHPSVLLGAFKRWQQQAAEQGLPWVAQRLVDPGDQAEDNRSSYAWERVSDSRQLLGAGLVVVHPALAGYDPRRGLLLAEGTGFRSTCEKEDAAAGDSGPRACYHMEPYLLHVQRLMEALEDEALAEMTLPAAALERRAGWAPGSLSRAARLACALHDVGKLTQAWQGWVTRYQKAIGQPAREPLAHTEYDSANPDHYRAQQQLKARPPHAAEGALAVTVLLHQALGGNEALTRATVTAIARHHGPFTGDCQPFRLIGAAREQVEASLRLSGLGAGISAGALWAGESAPTAQLQLRDLLARPDHTDEWLAYTLLVRALRRADQAGTAMGSQEP